MFETKDKSQNSKLFQDLTSLGHVLEAYLETLSRVGLKDHQVPFIQWWSVRDILSSGVYGLFVLTLASIPSVILNAPVGFAARIVARKEQKRALAGSKVKVTGRDVVLSKKILFSLVAVPCLWMFYFVLVLGLTSWKLSSVLLLFLCFPLFSYFGVRTVEAGMIEFRNIQPLFYRLLPKYRRMQDELPKERQRLQRLVKTFVQKYEPELGVLAQAEAVDWTEYMRHHVHDECASSSSSVALAKSEENIRRSAGPSSLNEPREGLVKNPTTTSTTVSKTLTEENPNRKVLSKSHSHVITTEHDISFLDSDVETTDDGPPQVESKKTV